VRASCVAAVRLVNLEPCRADIRRLLQGIEGRNVRGFLNAASPGLIAAFQPNRFYPDHSAYLADLVTAMRPEYEAIAGSGLHSCRSTVLIWRCPPHSLSGPERR
jgi:5-methyltetrahydropteroyltriglutamate--homocysteine methyltransferase